MEYFERHGTGQGTTVWRLVEEATFSFFLLSIGMQAKYVNMQAIQFVSDGIL